MTQLNIKPRSHRARFVPNSLQFRLTVGVAVVSAIGLGSVALWFGWRMEHILLTAHRDNVERIFDRLPAHIEMYEEVYPTTKAIQKSIDRVAGDGLYLWIEGSQGGDITWRSPVMRTPEGEITPASELRQHLPIQLGRPEITKVDGRYWILCAQRLQLGGRFFGTAFVAEDVNANRLLLVRLIRNLGLVSAVSIAIMIAILTAYVRRSLTTLQVMCRLVEQVSAEHLQAELGQLSGAPHEVRYLARAYDRMLGRLSDSWEQQRQFVSNISHELRTPLTIVSGYLQSTLRRGENLSSMQKEALTTASEEADRTIQLLDDLLTLARADNGHMHFRLDWFDLEGLLGATVEMVSRVSNRQIDLDLGVRGAIVRADRDRLRQVLLNLLDNAMKYSPDDTPVTVRLTAVAGHAQIQVCDRGRGIPLLDQARIFERFYRVDEARARSTGGTGLGLSIVKTLIEGMGGSISVHSRPGKGSIFTVTLPLSPGNPQPFQEKTRPPAIIPTLPLNHPEQLSLN